MQRTCFDPIVVQCCHAAGAVSPHEAEHTPTHPMHMLVLQSGETGSPKGASGSPRGTHGSPRSPKLPSPSQAQGAMMLALSAACLYGAAAISMNFINKASLHVYPLPNALLLLQMLATLLALLPLHVTPLPA